MILKTNFDFKLLWLVSFLLVLFLSPCYCGKDFYDLLGIQKDATKSEIRKAFKKIALEKHPDKNKGKWETNVKTLEVLLELPEVKRWRTDDPNAHAVFTEINKAYEVLKDDELRKKYDLYGEEGLKDDHFGGQYQSWKYYKEQFGIYDEDPEIITLDRADFEQSVRGSDDIWFINFYSPYCGHCHTLAPEWRKAAHDLDGVIRIGAVNCHDDWMLCNQEYVQSYPSLKIYPTGEFYYGQRDAESMVNFIVDQIQVDTVDVTDDTFDTISEDRHLPWILNFCHVGDDCLNTHEVVKLAAMLDNLVHVGQVNCDSEIASCRRLGHSTGVVFFPAAGLTKENGKVISSLDSREIMTQALKFLPQPEDITIEAFPDLKASIVSGSSSPWLLVFVDGDESSGLELKKLTALIPDVSIGSIDCQKQQALCKQFHVTKHPSVLLQKADGYEFHHGRYTAHDVANFARDSATSNVITLGPDDFPAVTQGESWFIDFFAPWCPPCMRLLPEWRKAGKQIGGRLAKFGTVDCTIHTTLCKQYNIHSYPSAMFYNQSIPHKFSGHHSAEALISFAEDILHPPVVILTPQSFDSLIGNKPVGETWVVDFYAPWCGPCMQLAPTFRELAKKLEGEAKLGQVDCQMYSQFCHQQGVNSYPTLRLYPHDSKGIYKHVRHQGWRDLGSLYSWVFSSFPSLVEDLGEHNFYNDVIMSEDSWVVDFYAPWCGHCVQFAPHFQALAKRMEGIAKFGKVNCDAHYSLCREVAIRSYPNIRLYRGSVESGMSQPIDGEILNNHNTDHMYAAVKSSVENHRIYVQENKRRKEEKRKEKQKTKKKKAKVHDEF